MTRTQVELIMAIDHNLIVIEGLVKNPKIIKETVKLLNKLAESLIVKA